MTITIIKIIAVVVILAAMLVILMGIGHLYSGNFNTDMGEMDQFRKDVENKEDVVSSSSAFHQFLAGRSVEKGYGRDKR